MFNWRNYIIGEISLLQSTILKSTQKEIIMLVLLERVSSSKIDERKRITLETDKNIKKNINTHFEKAKTCLTKKKTFNGLSWFIRNSNEYNPPCILI